MIRFRRILLPSQVNISIVNVREIAESSLAIVKNRVFQRGEDYEGRPLSPYSSNGPIYIPKSGVGSGSPLHKPKGGIPTKRSMRFTSYAAFRRLSGLTPNKTLTISGTLARRFRVIQITKTGFVLGWNAGTSQAVIATAQHNREGRRVFRLSSAEVRQIAALVVSEVTLK